MNLVNLNSVGCFIDTKTGNTYPELVTGKADLTDPVNILDTDKEWDDGLSPEDAGTVLNIAYTIGLFPTA